MLYVNSVQFQKQQKDKKKKRKQRTNKKSRYNTRIKSIKDTTKRETEDLRIERINQSKIKSKQIQTIIEELKIEIKLVD